MSWERITLRAVHGAAPASIPVLIYGTAWKHDRTAELVHQALSAGFRAVDTAAQPKHYQEDLVGAGIRKAIREETVRREDLYVQTKYTSAQGQDPLRMPYDPTSSITDQVHASIRSSLHNLRIREEVDEDDQAYIDTVLLHSPLPTMTQTLEAWAALETYVPHRIRNLGLSNCTLAVLEELYRSPQVRIKPAVIQNRFYPTTRFDGPLRAFCREHGIIYQSFWTLTANPQLLRSAEVAMLAQEAGISTAAALYCLILGLGHTTVLDGTTNAVHMAEDLAAPKQVERYATERPDAWQKLLASFKTLIRDDS
ncbi:NADP-dependent oxidoreductase domain-containing protein [Paecilomyces variotii]|uniref:NADP-dependent oxidoreductase domain-containing protein n=1 Tax=Byssochlamys spectabilis TaxID=264951 RepID=A0A443HJ67_BYSSP|nr:NADP-dependent oxidoreductase domain-containing protein [Paecilomyces variotii]KAJ9221661.1 hypothetical protein DTO169C6_5986 [Paecilomyces variotii]KAJ9231347.1 hypothetical protein DTO166G5_6826 [Paecilomyces variotii]KAJ9256258.1 hypothetical protein DTO195F2_5983 [Paecilomyces variotii]KAJ9329806.1 hypothetical protein DTO027B3_293 [Paecilomyces variotii]KAJ9331851.1 hypothetical protein DTO027B5_6382 [Paecilomyces variotii]